MVQLEQNIVSFQNLTLMFCAAGNKKGFKNVRPALSMYDVLMSSVF